MSNSNNANNNNANNSQETNEPIVLKKPVFVKVKDLEPASKGHNLYVRVGELKTVLSQPRYDGTTLKIGEALVGDETGSILLTARNEQMNKLTKDTTIILRNAKVEMFKNHMRLAVDRWGLIELAPSSQAISAINTSSNLSDTEYELVAADE